MLGRSQASSLNNYFSPEMMNLQNNYYPTQSASYRRSGIKRLGAYLIEAGLLTPAQIQVALNDQEITGMRFGEIIAAHGWVKQQTIEFLMERVILPERQAASQQTSQDSQTKTATSISQNAVAAKRNLTPNSDRPISKRPSSIKSSSDEDDVTWIG
jgi:hypothetical protein